MRIFLLFLCVAIPGAFTFQAPLTPRRPIRTRTTVFSSNADPVASLEALDALVPRSKITLLTRSKSDIQGALQVAFHLGAFAVAAALPAKYFSLPAMAFCASFFFHALHETVHRTAFSSKLANDALAHFFGFLCLRPARHYFYYHWQHHKHTGDPALDSELQSGSFLDIPVKNVLGYLFYLSGIPFWIDAVSTTVKHAWGVCPETYLPTDAARREVTVEARVYLALYTMVALLSSVVFEKSSTILLRYWIYPALLGQPFLRFYLLAEHRGRRSSPLITENTRTMRTLWFYRRMAWCMPYHLEHHAWPSVPFHKLHMAHDLLVQAGGGEEFLDSGEVDPTNRGKDGYVAFHFKFLRRLLKSQRT